MASEEMVYEICTRRSSRFLLMQIVCLLMLLSCSITVKIAICRLVNAPKETSTVFALKAGTGSNLVIQVLQSYVEASGNRFGADELFLDILRLYLNHQI